MILWFSNNMQIALSYIKIYKYLQQMSIFVLSDIPLAIYEIIKRKVLAVLFISFTN